MKRTFYILLLIITGTLSACSDDEAEGKRIGTEPNVSQITISEVISSDGGMVSKKDTYSFTANQLMKRSTLQEFYGQSVTYENTFSYSDHQAKMTDDKGNVATYTLNDNGYALKCNYQMGEQIREYDFSYIDNNLTQIDEKIDGELFSTIEMEYLSGGLQAINVNGNKTLCRVGNDTNKYNLPCILLYDLHPLSLHIDAIFARLLGKQSTYLVTRTAPEGSEDEWTEYAYTLDKDNKPTQITAATTSTGIVYDKHGNPSEVTRTDKRAIQLEIE